jgi:hypothetical protein
MRHAALVRPSIRLKDRIANLERKNSGLKDRIVMLEAVDMFAGDNVDAAVATVANQLDRFIEDRQRQFARSLKTHDTPLEAADASHDWQRLCWAAWRVSNASFEQRDLDNNNDLIAWKCKRP